MRAQRETTSHMAHLTDVLLSPVLMPSQGCLEGGNTQTRSQPHTPRSHRHYVHTRRLVLPTPGPRRPPAQRTPAQRQAAEPR